QPQCRQHGRERPFDVAGPAAIEAPVYDARLEWTRGSLPAGDGVHVALEQQPAPAVSSVEVHQDVVAARKHRLALDEETQRPGEALDVAGAARLAVWRPEAHTVQGIHAGEGDEIGEDGRDVGGGDRPRDDPILGAHARLLRDLTRAGRATPRLARARPHLARTLPRPGLRCQE